MTHPGQALEVRRFPLKRYYLIYGGLGSLLFYVLLFFLFVQAERRALYAEYEHHTAEKARGMYDDVARDFLKPHGLTIEHLSAADAEAMAELRHEIDELLRADFQLAEVKMFRPDGYTLYNSEDQTLAGTAYDAITEEGFQAAAAGTVHCEIEEDDKGRRTMEAYLPVVDTHTQQVTAIFEIYEDVSRFESLEKAAIFDAFGLPTLVYVVFNLVLFGIVARADRIISERTNLLIDIRQNMEKYLSSSAVNAICQSVSNQTDLFKGERQQLVVFFSDVRGFTSYSENTPPEDVVRTLNRLFEIQAQVLDAHGGVIDKYVGDEVMATFPAGAEDAAVQAGLDILQRMSETPELDRQIGIGIHAGEAVVGSIGAAARRDYTAIGDTINVGARLCAACPPRGIYISDTVFNALSPELQARFGGQDSLSLKGKSAAMPIHAHTPTAAKA